MCRWGDWRPRGLNRSMQRRLPRLWMIAWRMWVNLLLPKEKCKRFWYFFLFCKCYWCCITFILSSSIRLETTQSAWDTCVCMLKFFLHFEIIRWYIILGLAIMVKWNSYSSLDGQHFSTHHHLLKKLTIFSFSFQFSIITYSLAFYCTYIYIQIQNNHFCPIIARTREHYKWSLLPIVEYPNLMEDG